MSSGPRRHWLVFALVMAALTIATLAVHGAGTWYRRPFAGILLDPDGTVSSLGLPSWDGFQQGLRYPDQVISVDGIDLSVGPGRPYRAAAWDRAIEAASGRESIPVVVRTASGERALALRITPFEPLAFWVDAGGLVAIGLLYVVGAVVALAASPRGRLARTFAKATLFGALFLLTLFDYHTTRS